ncbi:MAG: cobyric acid synthase [Paracoccaceae bacterium]|nr:cobyric acid synthase [Paracoccaceae bacterium]
MSASIMIQGTGSSVGKSLIAAGLCRCLRDRGYRVRPFKPQNMSNNAAVTIDGGEIGRAQALQAMACGIEPDSRMNPVLLKPETDAGAQVVLNGKRLTTVEARDYARLKPQLMPPILDDFRSLRREADFVIIEGAGSPAETNLRAGDIANMGFAEAADIPVILTGDIDRGGVIAQVVGTHSVLAPADRERIRGFVINKFRGELELFAEGVSDIAGRTGWFPLGILPWFSAASRLPAEDSASLQSGRDFDAPQALSRATGSGPDPSREKVGKPLTIAVPMLSRMANFDDLDPLHLESRVSLEFVRPGRPIPAETDLVLLTGTKSTRGDLQFLRSEGWDIDVLAHHRRGGHVLGICGGYQMLGTRIDDGEGIEGPPGSSPGLGLLDVVTDMKPDKTLRRVNGRDRNTGASFRGYEIHIGLTAGVDCDRPWLDIEGRPEGSQSRDGRVMGCYVHGLFTSDTFRRAFLDRLGVGSRAISYRQVVESTLDALGRHVESNLDVDRILEIAR